MLFPYMVYYTEYFLLHIFSIISFALLKSNCYTFLFLLRTVCSNKMPPLSHNRKLNVRIVVLIQSPTSLVTKKWVYWYTLLYPASPFFHKTVKLRECHIFPKHSHPKPDVTLNCKLCYDEFPGFYDNIKLLEIPFLSSQQKLILTILSTKLMIRILKRSCKNVNISS